MNNHFFNIALMICVLLLTPFATASAEKISVIVNKSNSENFDKSKVKRIFLKEFKMWGSGKEVVPIFTQNPKSVKEIFSKNLLGKDLNELKLYWIQKKLTDSVRPPVSLKEPSQAKKYVAKIPNAIAFIPSKDIDGSVKSVFELE